MPISNLAVWGMAHPQKYIYKAQNTNQTIRYQLSKIEQYCKNIKRVKEKKELMWLWVDAQEVGHNGCKHVSIVIHHQVAHMLH